MWKMEENWGRVCMGEYSDILMVKEGLWSIYIIEIWEIKLFVLKISDEMKNYM